MNLYLHSQNGTLAQLVEQRTENPCVPGSIPGGTTKTLTTWSGFFVLYTFDILRPVLRIPKHRGGTFKQLD